MILIFFKQKAAFHGEKRPKNDKRKNKTICYRGFYG